MRLTNILQKIALSTICGLTLSEAASKPRQTLFGNSFGIAGKNASYDYVVVGGGTAGLTIAARLAQIPGASVAVIEAGSFYQIDNGNGSVIPALAPAQDTNTDPNQGALPLIDWRFVSTPQVVSYALLLGMMYHLESSHLWPFVKFSVNQPQIEEVNC